MKTRDQRASAKYRIELLEQGEVFIVDGICFIKTNELDTVVSLNGGEIYSLSSEEDSYLFPDGINTLVEAVEAELVILK